MTKSVIFALLERLLLVLIWYKAVHIVFLWMNGLMCKKNLRLISIPLLLLLYRCGLDVVKRLLDTAITIVSLCTGYSKVVVRHHCYPWVTVDWM